MVSIAPRCSFQRNLPCLSLDGCRRRIRLGASHADETEARGSERLTPLALGQRDSHWHEGKRLFSYA